VYNILSHTSVHLLVLLPYLFAAISICSMHGYGSLKLINGYMFQKTPTCFGTELLPAAVTTTKQYKHNTLV
jgi:hypothetical protein